MDRAKRESFDGGMGIAHLIIYAIRFMVENGMKLFVYHWMKNKKKRLACFISFDIVSLRSDCKKKTKEQK